MGYQFRVVQVFIIKKQTIAVYTHCFSHNLKMCLSDASKIPSMRNHIDTINEVCVISHASQKDSKS